MKKILGMGNALVDIMIPLDDYQILDKLELPKGRMQLVDKERSRQILALLKDYKRSQSAGGSAANAIHGIATLGGSTGYIGAIGEDELGGFFVRELINAGVEPHLIHSKEETGRAITLVTPDSERTFATYLGAASELSVITSHQSPVTSHQSPITSHQSPVTSHQSPITDHRSPVTNHQSPVTNTIISTLKASWCRIIIWWKQRLSLLKNPGSPFPLILPVTMLSGQTLNFCIR
jgi:hypothetical protein